MRKSQFFFYENIFLIWTQTDSEGFFSFLLQRSYSSSFSSKKWERINFFSMKISFLFERKQATTAFFSFLLARFLSVKLKHGLIIFIVKCSYLPRTYCESFRSWQLQLFLSICPDPGWNAPILIGQCMLGIHSSHTISDRSGQLLGYILSLKSCRVFLVSYRTEDTLVAKSSTVFKC